VRLGVDGRTVAVAAFAVVLAVVLGALAGIHAGVWAGVLASLAGLVAPPVLAVAAQRRHRNIARIEDRQQVLRRFAPPKPTSDRDGEERRPDKPDGLPVARYLRPEEAVVPFRARPELDELLNWCVSGGHSAVRLVTGEGGSGKTRLTLQLGDELAVNGWQPLWVPRGSEREAVAAAHTIGQPCVLVVDYAETRSELAGFLDDVAADQDGPDLRVLLLARSAGEWWRQLGASAEERTAALLEISVLLTLGPMRAAGGMQEVFDEALAGFAQAMGTKRPDTKLILSDPDPVVLVVHAAALLTVLDDAAGAQPPDRAVSAQEVLDALLRHEARYWVRSAAGRGLNLDVSVLRLVVAVGCLIGADSEAATGALLSGVPDLDSAERRGRVARWLHDLYPSAHDGESQEPEWLSPLRPDRLAEQLITRELTAHPALVPRLFTGLTESRSTRALTVLARAALTQDAAVGLLDAALAADLDDLAAPACVVAIETNPLLGELLSQALSNQPVTMETLARVAAVSPHPSLALAAPAAFALQRLANASADDNERAGWLVGLSSRLSELGRREEALDAIEEATGIYRQLAQARPDAFLPDLATALNNQSGRLSGLGRREEALASAEEAVTIRRQLVHAHPDAFLPDLATALNSQSNRLSDLGRRQEALDAIEEATGIYRQLAQARPDAFLPDLGTALNNQSIRLSDLGRREEALAMADEAVTIGRKLAQDRPDAFLPDLASALNNQSGWLSGLGRWEDGLAAAEEAVRIRRQLAQARPETFLPDLASALTSQSIRLSEVGRREEALAAAQEATGIYRQLAQDRPDAFLPNLATALNNQSGALSGLGRWEDGLAAAEEAVRIRRRLAQARPDAFLPNLATALTNKAGSLAELERWEEALAAAEEAADIYRRLAQDGSDTFLPNLAAALNNKVGSLAELGRQEEALAAAEEATSIYRQLAQDRPDAFLPNLAAALSNLAVTLSWLDRSAEASAARAEADAAVGALTRVKAERANDEANAQTF
jgi:Tetratricopeptide repeat